MNRCTLSVSCLLLLLLTAVCMADESSTATVGKPAPDFTATGIDGKEFTLFDKISSGKNIVLMFSRAHW